MQPFSELIKSDRPILVDFHAEWCGPCKMMPPILKELKSIVGEAVKIIQIDVDKNPDTARAYQVQSVPTLMIFKNGQVKWRQAGVANARQLQQVLSQVAG